jgi:hypothetical protein
MEGILSRRPSRSRRSYNRIIAQARQEQYSGRRRGIRVRLDLSTTRCVCLGPRLGERYIYAMMWLNEDRRTESCVCALLRTLRRRDGNISQNRPCPLRPFFLLWARSDDDAPDRQSQAQAVHLDHGSKHRGHARVGEGVVRLTLTVRRSPSWRILLRMARSGMSFQLWCAWLTICTLPQRSHSTCRNHEGNATDGSSMASWSLGNGSLPWLRHCRCVGVRLIRSVRGPVSHAPDMPCSKRPLRARQQRRVPLAGRLVVSQNMLRGEVYGHHRESFKNGSSARIASAVPMRSNASTAQPRT